ncbi:MAG: hypothetical protein AABW85_04535 [archaeon]
MFVMGTITLNVRDKAEEKFRKTAQIKFGMGKGSLGKAASTAFEQWADREMHGSEAKLLELLEEGFEMGKIKYKHRAELHER